MCIQSTDPRCWQSRPQMRRPGCSHHSSGRCHVCNPCDHSCIANGYEICIFRSTFFGLAYWFWFLGFFLVTLYQHSNTSIPVQFVHKFEFNPSPLVSQILGPSCTHFYHHIQQTMLSLTPINNKWGISKNHCANTCKCTSNPFFFNYNI